VPTAPSTYAANYPIRARSLNADLYTYALGNSHTPNGVLFHAQPPLIYEFVYQTGRNAASNTTGLNTSLAGSAGSSNWRNWYDTSLFLGGSPAGLPGAGMDEPDIFAAGAASAVVPGSSGNNSVGGIYLALGQATWGAQTNSGGANGVSLFNNGSLYSLGSADQASLTRTNQGYTIDLIKDPASAAVASYVKDSASASYALLASKDGGARTSRLGLLWISSDFPTITGPNSFSVPSPPAWSPSTAATSSVINGAALGAPLLFLNANGATVQRPVMRASGVTSGSFTTSTVKLVAPTVSMDNCANYSAGVYTIPCDGVYLVFVMTEHTDNGATGIKQSGVRVISGGTTDLYGSGYNMGVTGAGGPAPIRPCMTRLLGLRQGDTLQAFAFSNSASPTLGTNCRFIVLWMSAIAPSNGAWAWTPPDLGYRWQAGNQTSVLGVPGSLPAQLQQHLTNDISFLLQRPYLMAWQSTQQTALSSAFHTITMDTLGSRVHNVASGVGGDSYGGWTSGASNFYAAVVPGWYLCINAVRVTAPAATATTVVGIGYTDSANNAQGTGNPCEMGDFMTSSSNISPGGDGVGLFYLDVGDRLYPSAWVTDVASWSTNVGAGQESSFGVVWVSE